MERGLPKNFHRTVSARGSIKSGILVGPSYRLGSIDFESRIESELANLVIQKYMGRSTNACFGLGVVVKASPETIGMCATLLRAHRDQPHVLSVFHSRGAGPMMDGYEYGDRDSSETAAELDDLVDGKSDGAGLHGLGLRFLYCTHSAGCNSYDLMDASVFKVDEDMSPDMLIRRTSEAAAYFASLGVSPAAVRVCAWLHEG